MSGLSSKLDGSTDFLVRRARIPGVDLYEISDAELSEFERGRPGDLEFSIALFLLSVAANGVCTLVSAEFKSNAIQQIFVTATVVSVIVGVVMALMWWRARIPRNDLCERIRKRMPSDRLDPEPDSDPDPVDDESAGMEAKEIDSCAKMDNA